MTTEQAIAALRSHCARRRITIDPTNPDDVITYAITILNTHGVDSQEFQAFVQAAVKVVSLHVDLILANAKSNRVAA